MLKKIVKWIGGDPHQEILEAISIEVEEINELESAFEALSDDQLRGLTDQFRLRLARDETLDDVLPEAFAAVREASKRTIGQRHYDVQMIGGIVMHREMVAEMKTGEGKTLGATLPLYLNALALNPAWVNAARNQWGSDPEAWEFRRLREIPVGRGVHLITVNDYLARRDARWMAPIYNLLGMEVGVLQMAARTDHGKKAFLVDLALKSPHEDRHQLETVPRRKAYQADILYGTNNEFGFDYLRDNMAMKLEERVQRGHHYAIIDEVDNVLIDEARTPLIISGPSHDDPEWYRRMASIVKKLNPEDYEINIRDRNITLTPLGETHVEELLGRSLGNPARPEDITPEQARLLGYLEQALRAEYIYKRNKDYLVQAGKVVIIDEFTGRLMPGRRWSDGLHQAVEAKENVKVQSENVTYATITIQNYFRMYEKLSGMTGTAVTEAEEFNEIYSLDPIAIPTNLDYLANWTDSRLITLQAQEPGSGFEYTFYADKHDPDRTPLYWKRKDYSDVIYLSEEAKLRAIAREIIRLHILGRPILVGTTSVENSEHLSRRLEGPAIRTLAYVLLIRDAWMTKHQRQPDGRRIPELSALLTPLEELRSTDLRNLTRKLDLDLSLNIKSPENLDRLLYLLELNQVSRDRLQQVLRRGIDHDVLNARKHTEESQIIAGAGGYGAVTIATSMAGRGVDIKLGGELAEEITADVVRVLDRAEYQEPYDMTMAEQQEALESLSPDDYGIYDTEIEYFLQHMEDKKLVKELGGLHVIGSERHEARRIDNQLRGRAARQGDPGSSRFYLSLEDELMARFGGQQMEALLNRMQFDEAMPIENRLVDRVVEQSQNRVEGANFDVRKHLLEYDDVLNTQREKVYQQRERIFVKQDLSEDVTDMLVTEVDNRIQNTFWEEQDRLDPDQAWRFLSWLSQTQPNLNFRDDHYPSYSVSLILSQIRRRAPELEPDRVEEELLEIADRTLEAEREYIQNTVDRLLDERIQHFENQLENRLETLDTFLEGLRLSADEEDARPIDDVREELTQLLRVKIELPAEQWRELRDTASLDIRDEIENAVRSRLRELEVRRAVGAAERIMGEELELDDLSQEQVPWSDLRERLQKEISAIFSGRRERYLGDPVEGQIIKSIRSALKGFPDGPLGEDQLVELLGSMAEGRRATFDKKSHRRVWLRTKRLNFTFYASRLLGEKDLEELRSDVIDHLVGAQERILDAWGRSEADRLAQNSLADLEELKEIFEDQLGEETFREFAAEPIENLPGPLQEKVKNILGRTSLSRIYRELLLRVISELWVEYLTEMEALRVSIGLEAYAQRDPLVQYKTKGFEMFQQLMQDMRMSVVNRMFTFQPRDVSSVQAAISGEGSRA